MSSKPSEIVELNSKEVEAMLDRAAHNDLREDDAELMRRIIESYSYITELIDDKNTSLRRLRKLLFGAQTEKAKNVLDEQENESCGSSVGVTSSDADSGNATGNSSETTSSEAAPVTTDPPRGHGRYGVDAYQGAATVDIPHPTFELGDACPDCNQGTLYQKTPSAIVRIVGQAPLGATVYRMQRLRCHLCGKSFTAPPPPDAGNEKYDITAASMIGLLKYGSGLPFNRLERLQRTCEIPLAASTQWDIVHATATLLLPVYDELIRQAAQGEVLHNDDTTVRILELMGERARKAPTENDELAPKRTGMFTSGVIAMRAGVGSANQDVQIALFFSGRQHAGENLADISLELLSCIYLPSSNN